MDMPRAAQLAMTWVRDPQRRGASWLAAVVARTDGVVLALVSPSIGSLALRDTGVVGIEDAAMAMGPEVAARLAAGDSVDHVARWLYLGPASGRPILAIKALWSAGVGHAEGKRAVDDVIADVAPEELNRWVFALQAGAAEAMESGEGGST